MTDIRQQLSELKKLNRNRYNYVIARAGTGTITEACRLIDVSTSWYYNFSTEEREHLEELAHELKYAKIEQALIKLEEAAGAAAAVMVDALENRQTGYKLQAAKEILDRVGVKADDKPKEINIHVDGLDDMLSKIWGDSEG